MVRQKKNVIPPDGGWGWMVCLGSGLITISLRSLDPSFGLLFGDFLEELDVETTGASVIISTLEVMANLSGLFVGPLINRYDYRKVALLGSILSCSGLILTSQATSVTYIICTYSILGGLGTGLAVAASFVAMTRYFNEKRSQAVGISMAATSIGMMCMPQIVNKLLLHYDFHGAVLVISALAQHAIVGSLLLQPVSWHGKPAPSKKDVDEPESESEAAARLILADKVNDRHSNVDLGKSGSKLSKVDLTTNDIEAAKIGSNRVDSGIVRPKRRDSFTKKLIDFFDLDLLKSPVYLNIVAGLGFYYVAESNFKMITPFFLDSIGMKKPEVAFSLSLTAFADILARVTMPTLFAKFNFKNRTIFWISCFLLAISRSTMALQTPGMILKTNLIFNGFLRGLTVININLTIAENCKPEKVPAALGIFMVVKFVLISALGPLLGYIRDSTGSYPIHIHAMSFLILISCVTWSIEFAMHFYSGNDKNKINKRSRNSVDNLRSSDKGLSEVETG
ncbi:monocarboxylate transporter 12 [Athalia rosae]|uniref:monocarboxylate transporter 12 n=1 Tax=Athalia rosae TaxID=37344 RepID=UPI002033BF99|nr:monocarboxylate transporter 12 [Athalia rosae]